MDEKDGEILHFKQGRVPELRFEWHPISKVVYVVQVDVPLVQADPFAWGVEDHGAAWNAVLIWCRGYIAHKIGYATLMSVELREERKSDGRVHP